MKGIRIGLDRVSETFREFQRWANFSDYLAACAQHRGLMRGGRTRGPSDTPLNSGEGGEAGDLGGGSKYESILFQIAKAMS